MSVTFRRRASLWHSYSISLLCLSIYLLSLCVSCISLPIRLLVYSFLSMFSLLTISLSFLPLRLFLRFFNPLVQDAIPPPRLAHRFRGREEEKDCLDRSEELFSVSDEMKFSFLETDTCLSLSPFSFFVFFLSSSFQFFLALHSFFVFLRVCE